MMNTLFFNKKTLTAITLVLFYGLAVSNVAQAANIHSVESLERERASLIGLMVDEQYDANTRRQHIKRFYRRLTDIERMVLRDERLLGNNNPTVKRAFGHYDLTFLVHASAEAKRDITDHWLAQSGLSTATVMSTKAGRR
jgi:hypothetical protein